VALPEVVVEEEAVVVVEVLMEVVVDLLVLLDPLIYLYRIPSLSFPELLIRSLSGQQELQAAEALLEQ
jgi:hypothetical protein